MRLYPTGSYVGIHWGLGPTFRRDPIFAVAPAPPVGPTGVPATLVGVSGFYSGIINAIAFIWSDGSSSETFGPTNNPGQIAFALSIPKGATLTGVFGNVGSQVNTLGLNYSPAQY